MNRLDQIIARKLPEIGSIQLRQHELRALGEKRIDFRDFAAAIKRGGGPVRIIAEAKQASPSAGTIVEEYNPVRIAQSYEANGANAVSVLTERNFFGGSIEHLRLVRAGIALPVLRKDFIVDEVQVYESAAAGADAILLIVAALEPEQLRTLHELARACRLHVLVEVHTIKEVALAAEIEARIIGINNRDLATFTVDLDTTERLLPHVPAGAIAVSESGIRDIPDIERMSDGGVDAVLVGEALMRADRTRLQEMLTRDSRGL